MMFDGLMPSVLTGVVFGFALFQVTGSFWYAARLGALAIIATTVAPIIVLALVHAPEAFPYLVWGSCALFWVWTFWELSRSPQRRT